MLGSRVHGNLGGGRSKRTWTVLGALAGLVVLAALTGCIGSQETDAQAASEEPVAEADVGGAEESQNPEAFTFGACDEQVGIFPVPRSDYEPLLPEGFEIDPFDPAGQLATLATPHLVCELPDGTRHSEAWVFLFVDPPEQWENPDADFGHILVLQGIIGSQFGAQTYASWGFEHVVQHGPLTLDGTQTPTAREGIAQADSAGFSSRLVTTVQGPPETLDGHTTREFALASDGTIAGAKDVSWTEHRGVQQGEAVLDVSGPADLHGFPVPDRPGIGFHLWGEGYDFTQTRVDLPELEG